MSSLSEFADIIKTIALNAVEASKPMKAVIGKVTSNEPLEIKVSQKQFLYKENLILPEGLFSMERNIAATENLEGEITIEKERYDGTKYYETYPYKMTADSGRLKIQNGLSIGDVVMLLRVQAGQKYIVLGRLAT